MSALIYTCSTYVTSRPFKVYKEIRSNSRRKDESRFLSWIYRTAERESVPFPPEGLISYQQQMKGTQNESQLNE